MKGKVYFYLLLFMAFSVNSKEQNLVPNYSLENYTKCSTIVNQFTGYVSNWGGGGGGLSYFDSVCYSPASELNVPLNIFGYQYPHTGNAYGGIYTFVAPPPSRPYDSNNRAYMQVKLIDSLKSSEKYYVTFYVSLADSYKYACNDIGAYFSDSALVWSGYAKPYLTPQLQNNATTNPLIDKINWIKVSGSFIAKGKEAYIVIGNFKNDKQSDSVFVGSPNSNTNHNWNEAYYYIDDVIVSADSNYADSLAGVNELKIKNYELKVFPNPSDGKFTFQLIISNEQLGIKNTVEIYNELGQKIYSQFSILNSQFSIDISSQPSGIYFYRVTTQQGELIGSGKLIIE